MRFLDAFAAAVGSDDIETMLGFYHPDAQLRDVELEVAAVGWRQIAAAFEAVPIELATDAVFISEPWAALVSPESGAAVADMFLIQDGGITLHLRAHADADVDGELSELFVGSAAAYSAHDVDALLAYHSAAPFAPEPPRLMYQYMFEQMPAIAVTPLTLDDLGVTGNERPAVFETDMSHVSPTPRSTTAVGVYRLTTRPGVESQVAVLWELWDREILQVSTLFEPLGWERVVAAEDAEPPQGWFSNIAVPEQREAIQTHTIDTARASTVAVYNASDATADLIRWAFRRYEAAGLESPLVVAIHMESDRSCLEGMGWAATEGKESEIRICLSDEELGDDEHATLTGRVTVLHELGHVWASQHVDIATQAAFLAERGLEVWADQGVPWYERGFEHAAEVVAWGLLDEPFTLARIGSPSCDELRAAFRILTGSDPLNTC